MGGSNSIRGLALVAGTVAALSGAGVSAAPLKLSDAPYTYTVINQDLQAALLEFGSNVNLKTNVSQEVRGRISGRLPELSPAAFLDRLASLYNLEWYFDGQILHITSARESQTRLLVPGPVPFERLKSTLDAFGVSDERFAVQPAPNAKSRACDRPTALRGDGRTVAQRADCRGTSPAEAGRCAQRTGTAVGHRADGLSRVADHDPAQRQAGTRHRCT